jgi:hypothetical protein
LNRPNARVDTFPIETVVGVSPVVSWNADAGTAVLVDAEIAVAPPVLAGGWLFVDEQSVRVTARMTPTRAPAQRRTGAPGTHLLEEVCVTAVVLS